MSFKKRITVKNIIFVLGFILLSISIAFNSFNISIYRSLVSFDEALTYGRILKSEKDGLFSNAGFPGVVYDKEKILPDSILNDPDLLESYTTRNYVIYMSMHNQVDLYAKGGVDIPEDYYVYTSQTGGCALLYSAVNLILPFNNDINSRILISLSGMLLSFALLLFVGWCSRNFGNISAFVVYILIFISPWLIYLGSSIWWSVWTYYIPFLAMLLILERRHSLQGAVSEKTIFLILFIAVFVKHLLFGFEFVTTILLAIYPPIIYYFLIEKRSFISFLAFSIKAGVVSLLAVLVESFILFYQLSVLKGTSILSGFNEILFLYTKRGAVNEDGQSSLNLDSLKEMLSNYLFGDAFGENLYLYREIPDLKVLTYFSFIIITLILAVLGYLLVKKNISEITKSKYVAIVITTFVSILCPFSWYIIFIQHSLAHFHRDYIILYVPFMLYCFLLIGIFVSLLISWGYNLCNSKIKL